MNNGEKYIITIDGVDFSGKTTLWKNARKNENIQIRGILSNIAYGLKYNRDVYKMIEEYNMIPFNYVIYLLQPDRDTLLRNFNSRLKELKYHNELLIKEIKSFADTLEDSAYFDEAYKLLKEKYKGDLIITRVIDNDIDSFMNYIKDFELYTKEEIDRKIDGNFTSDSVIVIESTIDAFEAKAKTESEYTKIVFINELDKETIMDDLYNLLDEKYKGMIDFLCDQDLIENKTQLYDTILSFIDKDNITVDDVEYYLDNYVLNIEAEVTCDIRTTANIEVSLSKLENYNDIEEYVYDREHATIQNELEYELENTEYNIENIEVSQW